MRGTHERAVIPRADVFEHADRYEDVVVAAHVTIIVFDELDAVGEPFEPRTRAIP